MQRERGNAFVARALGPEISRQGDGRIPPSPVETTEAAGPTEIASGGSIVRATPGGVDVIGGAVNVNAGLSRFSGVVQADTIIANSVIAASYTPGAGNLQ
jgi:hypothetical protein